MYRIVRSPVTLLLAAASTALFFLVNVVAQDISLADALRWNGAAVLVENLGEPELIGLFSLWDLELWRVPLSLLHHAGAWRWIGSLSLFAFVGVHLEPIWGSRRFLYVWTLTSLLGFAVAWCVREAPLGLFTGTCGLIMTEVRRCWGRGTASRGLPPAVITLPTIYVLLMAVATFLGRWHAPYIAWAAGMSAGWGLGKTWAEEEGVPPRWSSWFRLLPFLAAAMLFLAVHPVWLGSYWWHQANRSADRFEREVLLEKAISAEPSMMGPRLQLAQLRTVSGEPQRGWETLLEAIQADRRDLRAQNAAKRQWKLFRTLRERQSALATLKEQFDQEASVWEKRLELDSESADHSFSSGQSAFHSEDPSLLPEADRYRLDQQIELPVNIDGETEFERRSRPLPPPDLNRPDSAAEGRAL